MPPSRLTAELSNPSSASRLPTLPSDASRPANILVLGPSDFVATLTKDRRVSVTDGDMRHGRKSNSKRFNGYKRHFARELDGGMILAGIVRPANEPEHLAADALRPEIEAHGAVAELHIDRGYLASTWTHQMFDKGQRILAKPWSPRNGDRFPCSPRARGSPCATRRAALRHPTSRCASTSNPTPPDSRCQQQISGCPISNSFTV